ncbi:peroxidase [Phototrophicus methaneseepsis]|uniref:Peroxidase n=1 Tax=Phototrophicus methaneseepsis TaxID=2710758 RepID=A0A7S8ID93_9CHLR|nr:heme peroxidase family protein [Phototrophicus methaneseepsis]QPC81301.1 peroxidase [Phototrophicus methaneseepsis]
MKKSKMAHRRRGHGRSHYYIVGEGMCPVQIDYTYAPGAEKPYLPAPDDAVTPEGSTLTYEPPPAEEIEFRFMRLFPDAGKFEPADAALIALGQVMEDLATEQIDNSNIPAGYTYLGQFIDHDITFTGNGDIEGQAIEPQNVINRRSPFLDLDSVYNGGPDVSPALYEADKVHFKIGTTLGRPLFGVTQSLPNDLPRQGNGNAVPKQAIIGDPRNDENLAVAQIHLHMLKFHNKVADSGSLANETNAKKRFEEARKIVTQHYQSVVLHDFVPRIVDPDVYNDIMANGRHFYCHDDPKVPAMPVEFSVAAFRLGHSMIRNQYEWNRVFSTTGPGPVASLALLFEFSQLSGDLGGDDTLPTDWVADWTRLFDFTGVNGIENNPIFNFARLIDTQLATKLMDLPEFATASAPHLMSLSVRNLLRGRLIGLPSGQEVAKLVGATALTPDEIKTGPHAAILEANNFLEDTPLWYYVLKEAHVQQGGQKLGQVGSRIVVETFHGLVEVSRHSILQEQGWAPSLPSVDPDRFTMADLLAFVDEVNPLGVGN